MANLSCSQCSFTAQFESALSMHKQLHHGGTDSDIIHEIKTPKENFCIPKTSFEMHSDKFGRKEKIYKLSGRSSSATRLLGKLRAKICRSKTLFVHEEESDGCHNDLPSIGECSSKFFKSEPRISTTSPIKEDKETYGCHLCTFDADRITVLDRHLLNDHKLGMETLLKLVMAKTKSGLSTDDASAMFGIRQPYYRPERQIIKEGEFIIENVAPTIKVLKYASTNTDLKWYEVPDLTNNCRMISEELEKFIKQPSEKSNNDDFLTKMQTLNEYMCKFFDSSNTMKRALNKEFESKGNIKDDHRNDELFDLSLGDQETPRGWNRSQGDLDKRRSGHLEKCRSEKSKFTADSFYF